MSENGLAPDRVDFSKIKTSIPIPNLIEVQKDSYKRFLQMDLLPNEREDIGLQTVFNSVFPISDFNNTASLEFVTVGLLLLVPIVYLVLALSALANACRTAEILPPPSPFDRSS